MSAFAGTRIIACLMNGKEILVELKVLNLPRREYTVVGGGALAIRGIREAEDIDLLATPRLYEGLKGTGWEETDRSDSDEGIITFGGIDVGMAWSANGYEPNPIEVIQASDIIEEIRFVNLPSLVAWKQACSTERDLRDIELIERHLSEPRT